MSQTIRERADTVGTLRYVSVFLMETLARWVPSTPELEAKVLFGRHVWEFAQHADALGKRTAELRAALHYSPPPTEPYSILLRSLASTETTTDRIAAFYEGMLPELAARYFQYLAATDALLDDPTVRIIERVVSDLARMRADASAVLAEPSITGTATLGAASALAANLSIIDPWVAHRPPAASSGAIA